MKSDNRLGCWLLGWGLLLGFLFSSPGIFAQRIPVEDLSLAMQIPIITVNSKNFKNSRVFEGKFYKYLRFPGNFPHGLLIPKQDQSTNRPSGFFSNQVINGEISAEAAATLYDKIDQLRRLEHFSGPHVQGIALIKDGSEDDSYTEIGLVVEHLDGDRIQPLPELRTAKEQREFLSLFVDMGDNEIGLLPLDYHSENTLEKNGILRPVDVLLVPAREVLPLSETNRALYHLRMHQVGYTVISIEESLARGDLRKLSATRNRRCRELLAVIKSQLPGYEFTREFIKDELRGRASPKTPARRNPYLVLHNQ